MLLTFDRFGSCIKWKIFRSRDMAWTYLLGPAYCFVLSTHFLGTYFCKMSSSRWANDKESVENFMDYL